MTRHLAMGKLADGTYGLRVAKSGCDANANPPVPQNLAFDSNWPALLPIHQAGTQSFGNGTTVVNYPALPYLPMCGLFLQQNGRRTDVAWGYPDYPTDGQVMDSGYSGGDFLQIYVGASSLSCVYQYGTGDVNAASWTLHYVIYKTGL